MPCARTFGAVSGKLPAETFTGHKALQAEQKLKAGPFYKDGRLVSVTDLLVRRASPRARARGYPLFGAPSPGVVKRRSAPEHRGLAPWRVLTR